MTTRLRNKATGVVVSVNEATAAALGRQWEPVKAPAPAEPAAARAKRGSASKGKPSAATE